MPEDSGLRILFLGTGAFGVPALRRVAIRHDICAVYTQPPRPAGRGHRERPTPVHETALELGIKEIRTPETLRDAEAQKEFAALGADLALVAAYGLLLPGPVLAAPRLGCVNIHASLLPRWRGAAPIQRAIEAGDRETGVTFFVMDEGIDTGPVLASFPFLIPPRIRAGELQDRLAEMAAERVLEVLASYAAGTLSPQPQPREGATYARKIRREEGHLDFRQPAEVLERRIRAFDPWPGCWCFLGDTRLRVLDAEVVEGRGEPGTVIAPPLVVACGEKALDIRRLQRPGRRPLDAETLQRGFPIPVGSRLS